MFQTVGHCRPVFMCCADFLYVTCLNSFVKQATAFPQMFPQYFVGYQFNTQQPNVVVEWLAVRIQKVPSSNLGLETVYPDRGCPR